jgi:uncharacterized protein (TIGR02391 family)
VYALVPEGGSLRNTIDKMLIEEKEVQFDFWNIIHKDIAKVAEDKFKNGHYADAVESAFKEINKYVKKIVKEKSGEEVDGADLMNEAFSVNNPIIVLDDLSSETGKNVQKGYMQIFSGAMTGVRNPCAHENITIEGKETIHLIFLASLLMYKIEKSQFTK